MKENYFYFLSEQYFIDFPDKGLMTNHEIANGKEHNRPCFYMLKDSKHSQIMWMIPISSKVEKYKAIHTKKLKKYKKCDTLAFGKVLGRDTAFLIQNICPVIEKYIAKQYTVNNKAVAIIPTLEKELYHKTKNVLSLINRGIKATFPDVQKIKQELINQLEQEKKQQAQSKPKPIRRGGRVAPMQFPPSTRQPLAPIKRKTVKPKQPAAENVQQVQPKPKTKRKLVLEVKQDNGNDKYRGR